MNLHGFQHLSTRKFSNVTKLSHTVWLDVCLCLSLSLSLSLPPSLQFPSPIRQIQSFKAVIFTVIMFCWLHSAFWNLRKPKNTPKNTESILAPLKSDHNP